MSITDVALPGVEDRVPFGLVSYFDPMPWDRHEDVFVDFDKMADYLAKCIKNNIPTEVIKCYVPNQDVANKMKAVVDNLGCKMCQITVNEPPIY